jgi:hypothetical protein
MRHFRAIIPLSLDKYFPAACPSPYGTLPPSRNLKSRSDGIKVTADDADSQKTQVFTNEHENALPDHYQLIEMLGRGGNGRGLSC